MSQPTRMEEAGRTTREHVLEGIGCLPETVRMLFAGQSRGKLHSRL